MALTPNQVLTEKIATLVPTAKVQLNRRGISLDGTETMTDSQVAKLESIGMQIGMSRRTGWLELKADMSELEPKLQAFLNACQEEADAERATLPVGETTAEAWMRNQRDASMADDQMLAIENALKSGKLTTEQLPAMIARLEAGEGKTLTAGARLIVIERLQAMLQAPAPAQACKYCAQPSLATGEFCQAHQDIRDAQAAKAAQIAEGERDARIREKIKEMPRIFR